MTGQRGSAGADRIVEYLMGPGLAELRQYLMRQRWFAGKTRAIETVVVVDWAVLDPARPLLLLLLEVNHERYYVPLSAARAAGETETPIAHVGGVTVVDAHGDPEFGRGVVSAIAAGEVIPGGAGRFLFHPLAPWAGPTSDELASITVTQMTGEQSNTSLRVGPRLMLKSFRRPHRGINPDLEIMQFLSSHTGYRHAPSLIGWVEHGNGGEPATLSVLQSFIDNAGDAWRHTLGGLRRLAEAVGEAGAPAGSPANIEDMTRSLAAEMRELGRVTGELHAALASDPSLAAFRPEPITRRDSRRWGAAITLGLERLIADAASAVHDRGGNGATAELLGRSQARLEEALAALHILEETGTHKIRCHGDYHLGQVLKTRESFAVIDFEGEPARSVEERRAKQSPLRDLAGMFRSFDYAVHSVAAELLPARRASVLATLGRWQELSREGFLDGYEASVLGVPLRLVPPRRGDLLRACAPFELEKACYELRYELDHRPDWVAIPLAGIARILGGAS